MFKKNALLFLMLMMSFSVVNEARAVPSFARQTNMPCSSCHTVYPELNAFGRQFKLNGYTLTGIQQIDARTSSNQRNLKINTTPPFSVMLQTGYTHVSKKVPDTQNDDIAFPQELSLFYAGEISDKLGSFIQLTYEQAEDKFGWDNTDIRYATTSGDNTFGITLNNSPSVQDIWNTLPTWGYPYTGSGSAPGPTATAATLFGMLPQDSVGLGGYAMWNGSIYTEVTLYRSAHLGSDLPDINSENTINGVAPYVRVAWQQNLGTNDYLMIGAYGMKGSLIPSGVAGPTDQYTDAAIDAQYEHSMDDNVLSVHLIAQQEKQTLDASSPGFDPKLNSVKIDGTYHWANSAEATLAYWTTTGDSGDYSGAPFGYIGSPDNSGYIAQYSYLPWQNTKLTAQYIAYNKFDGLDPGRSASDNDTLLLQAWLMW